MAELIPGIRNATRALITRGDEVLLLRKDGGGRGERFALPGGAQELGETLKDAVSRECLEEIGVDVNVGDLIHVADFFKWRDTEPPTRRHLIEFLFQCSVPADYIPRIGVHPDKHQVEVLWVALAELSRLPLVPGYLSTCIPPQLRADRSFYLGTFHDCAAE